MPEEFPLVREFAIIMALPGIALVAFRTLRLPPILGYLAAGIIVGPSTPPTNLIRDDEAIRLLADLGLIILLFALGLEFGWQRLRSVGLQAIIIGPI